jgi:hypothetical protein
MPLIDPDLLRIQRRSLGLLRSAVAEQLRAGTDIQQRRRLEEERARGESSRLEARVNAQLQEARTAFDKARGALKARNLHNMVQMVPASARATPTRGTERGGDLLKDRVAAIVRTGRSIESDLDRLEHSTRMTERLYLALAAFGFILGALMIWFWR